MDLFYYALGLLCNDGDLRLVRGKSPNEGTVQMCLSEEWGTVCDDLWGSMEAEVVCRQLGFNSTSKPMSWVLSSQ